MDKFELAVWVLFFMAGAFITYRPLYKLPEEEYLSVGDLRDAYPKKMPAYYLYYLYSVLLILILLFVWSQFNNVTSWFGLALLVAVFPLNAIKNAIIAYMYGAYPTKKPQERLLFSVGENTRVIGMQQVILSLILLILIFVIPGIFLD